MQNVPSTDLVSHEPQPPSGAAFFAAWLSFRQLDPYDPVSATATHRMYGNIWKLWLRHLQSRDVPWLEASPVDVAHFLKQLKARRTKTADGRVRPVSEVSQQRYWQVLHWVYVHAMDLGMCKRVPTGELHESDRPHKLNDDPTVLDPVLWLTLPKAFPKAGFCDSYGTRDLVILRLLYEHGLTSEELRDMHLTDLIWRPSAGGEISKEATNTVIGAHLKGSRMSQDRTVFFADSLCHAMDQWLNFRQSQSKYAGKEWVFLSDRANQISIRILFHLVSRTIEAAARQADIPLPLRCGPQVIRNTLIREKLELRWPIEKIMAFAGLKNPESVWRHAK